MSFHIYSVFRDGSHSCICVAVERKFTYFIPMEAAQVRVAQMEHRAFAEDYKPYPEYPVRRAAEIYLNSPDKEMTPKAKEHLDAIMADPAYAYDRSQFSQLNVLKEKQMARKQTAADVATEIDAKPKSRKEAVAEADKVIASQAPHHIKAGKPAAAGKVVAKKPAGKTAKAKAEKAEPAARKPAANMTARLKVGDASKVKGGFMAEFVARAEALQKASRGKGFTGVELVDSLVAEHEDERAADAAWTRTYIPYSLDEKRGILVYA